MRTRRSIIFAFLILPILILNHAWAGDTITGRVVSISDGDTITVLDNDKTQHKIRMWGIDCSESHQDFGNRAKQFTSDLVFGKTVLVKVMDTDRYGRTVGIVNIDSKTLNEELVKAGFAWFYGQYCKVSLCSQWNQYQEDARSRKIGLWSMQCPIPPWEFRHGSSKTAPDPSADTTQGSGVYHGNTSSKVFHQSSCKTYNCKNGTEVFQNRADAVKAGYKPCGTCMP